MICIPLSCKYFELHSLIEGLNRKIPSCKYEIINKDLEKYYNLVGDC